MSGQAFLVTFSATGKSDSPVRGETKIRNHRANELVAEPEQKAPKAAKLAAKAPPTKLVLLIKTWMDQIEQR